MYADVVEIMSEQPLRSSVVDARTGAAVATPPGRAKPIGWYDDHAVLGLAPGWRQALTLLFIDLQSGQVGRTPEPPGMIGVDDPQVGPVAEMSESARAQGFQATAPGCPPDLSADGVARFDRSAVAAPKDTVRRHCQHSCGVDSCQQAVFPP